VSLYQLQQCVYNYLRTLEGVEPGSPVPTLSTSGYDLSEEEERALKAETWARCIRWAFIR
jgi:hypothetical protein